MIISRYLDELERAGRSWFPQAAVPLVASHPGRMDVDAIRKHALASPALIFAPAQIGSSRPSGYEVDADLRVAAFVLARDKAPAGPASFARKDRVALSIIERLMLRLHFSDFVDVSAPEDVSAENLFNGTLDSMALTLWVVQWSVRVTIPASDGSDAHPFLHAHFEGEPPLTPWAAEITSHPAYATSPPAHSDD